MITAIKIAMLWIAMSLMIFITHYGGGAPLQPWQAIVSVGPALLLLIVELINTLMKAR
ncbi:hypothetical protein IFU23_05770 [Pantoea agglomerans]|uniref:Uncharacterized protein n=1 Tax=Enterobacter agglomerans TaxID=549 RepID=A0ACC5PVG4_ENTAG|nr:hypothetical protein [Pantoea agglomerans]MBD8129004.1 hypothetical protein [Pantoea agglomerans]MBD8152275.1 hypothetical protein [Pantoea agglomerans]MBD8157614.1 hypothetical protein [Pantoea agglomerans]MBD8231453.1 hypothetical protein [Pantoea agglomerans]MBD8241854.1 hypothetical protein [Pantoea agglomerans]